MTEWLHKKLGDVAKTFTGLTYSPNQVSESGVLVLRSSNIKDEHLCFDDNVFVSMDIPERAIVHENDILICVRNGSRNLIGKSTLITKEAEGMAFGAFMTVLRSNEIDPQLLLYIWQSNSIQRQVANNIGATINQITNADFNRFDISYPKSLSAQRRIAAILSSADKVIDSTQRLIEKYKKMKQGMMEELFNEQCTMNNVQWRKVRLGEVGEIITGSTPPTTKSEYWNGEYNFYSPADFDDHVYCCKTERTVTKAGANTGRSIPANSIMVACIASIGKIALSKSEGITNQQINTIVPNEEYDCVFLYYLLLLNATAIKNKAAQTTIPIINKEDFSSLEFYVPELAEQRRIASILSGIDAKIAAEEKVLEKYEKVKKGLMERLLEGK